MSDERFARLRRIEPVTPTTCSPATSRPSPTPRTPTTGNSPVTELVRPARASTELYALVSRPSGSSGMRIHMAT